MAYEAKVLKDSISPDGIRLTTLQVTLPRIIIAEVNTHRMFSRNSASSRAIPVEKRIAEAVDDPFIPIYWGKNQKGMVAEEELTPDLQASAEDTWLAARDDAVYRVKQMLSLGVHKQIANRMLEPWLWHTAIITATDWRNFWHRRVHPSAQPEMRRTAEIMQAAMNASDPCGLARDEWHLPLVDYEEMKANDDCSDIPMFWQKVSAGRCARVSYLTHDGKRDLLADVELCERLMKNGHLSPLEHVARPMEFGDAHLAVNHCDVPLGGFDAAEAFCGNLRGWVSLRKTIPHEDDLPQTFDV